MKFFHGSPVANIKIITPHISNHGLPLVYLTTKRENTIVYLSNAVEKYHKENHIPHSGKFYTWASYGFNKDGILVLEEYYPNATEETYKGVSGYIYLAEDVKDVTMQKDIPFAATTKNSVEVTNVEYIPDAYEELLKLNESGKIILKRYNENSEKKLQWIKNTIINEYKENTDKIDYITFLKAKFDFINEIVDE